MIVFTSVVIVLLIEASAVGFYAAYRLYGKCNRLAASLAATERSLASAISCFDNSSKNYTTLYEAYMRSQDRNAKACQLANDWNAREPASAQCAHELLDVLMERK